MCLGIFNRNGSHAKTIAKPVLFKVPKFPPYPQGHVVVVYKNYGTTPCHPSHPRNRPAQSSEYAAAAVSNSAAFTLRRPLFRPPLPTGPGAVVFRKALALVFLLHWFVSMFAHFVRFSHHIVLAVHGG